MADQQIINADIITIDVDRLMGKAYNLSLLEAKNLTPEPELDFSTFHLNLDEREFLDDRLRVVCTEIVQRLMIRMQTTPGFELKTTDDKPLVQFYLDKGVLSTHKITMITNAIEEAAISYILSIWFGKFQPLAQKYMGLYINALNQVRINALKV